MTYPAVQANAFSSGLSEGACLRLSSVAVPLWLCFRPDSRLSPVLVPSALPAIPLPAVFGVLPFGSASGRPSQLSLGSASFRFAAGQLPTDCDLVAEEKVKFTSLCVQVQNRAFVCIAGMVRLRSQKRL
jgi:hypothetical protein